MSKTLLFCPQITKDRLSHRADAEIPTETAAPRSRSQRLSMSSRGERGKGGALLAYLRRPIEDFFQQDLSSVRIHFSFLPERLGAIACTHGTNIYFSPVWSTLSHRARLFLLGHELTHVVQQWEGRLPSCDSPFLFALSDPELERTANVVGNRLTRYLLGRVSRNRLDIAFSPRRSHANWNFIQCYIAIQLPTMAAPEELTDPDSAYDDIRSKADVHLQASLIMNKDEIKAVLAQWIGTSRYRVIRFIRSQPAVHRTYKSWSSLARALIGEVNSAPNLEKENDLAKKTKESGYINDHLATLIPKIAAKVDQEPDSAAKKSLASSWHNGKYYPWYYHLLGGFPAVLKDPKKYSFSTKVAVLHDLSDFFNDTNPVGATDVPPDKQLATAIVDQNAIDGSDVYNKVPMGATINFRHPDGTLIEESPIIKAARDNKMPLSYGPSYTTGRLMQLTHFSGGTADEFQAMAWGIFAFWNQDYYTSQSGIHRFHCVMDMASNYGVPYTPFTYPLNPPDYSLQILIL